MHHTTEIKRRKTLVSKRAEKKDRKFGAHSPSDMVL